MPPGGTVLIANSNLEAARAQMPVPLGFHIVFRVARHRAVGAPSLRSRIQVADVRVSPYAKKG